MEDQKLFQIGEVAKMFHVSMGTLRHYERSGLLTPEVIDERTGYRYYGIRQMEVLNTIRYLRVLDIPLPQIRDFLQNRDTLIMEDKLTKQKELIHQKIQELELIERKIDHRLQRLQDAMHARLDEISLVTIPGRADRFGSGIHCAPIPTWIWNILSAGWKKIKRNPWFFLERWVWASPGKTWRIMRFTIMIWSFCCWIRRIVTRARWKPIRSSCVPRCGFGAAIPRHPRSMKN